MSPSPLPDCRVVPRPVVQHTHAYRPPLEGRRHCIRLDFNENTTGFPANWPLGLAQDETLVTTYPEYERLTHALAKVCALHPDQVLITNGSDEALNVIPQTFIQPQQDRALVCLPTFAMIPHALRLSEAVLTALPLTPELTYDVDAIESALQADFHKLVVLASPDNPTGAMLEKTTLSRWCEAFPETLFVLDEAYSEYQGADFTAMPLVQRHGNLLVTRTFSKAWGLAGLRLGLVAGHPQLLDYLRRVRSPYSVNTVAVEAALALLPKHAAVLEGANQTMVRRTQLMQALTARGYDVKAGGGNFFLMNLGATSTAFTQFLRQKGLLVRDQSHQPMLAGHVRVSVGSEGENQTFLQALALFEEKTAIVFDLDDTLVDTSQSFDRVVQALVSQHCPAQPLVPDELRALRAEGGFNDDWDATVELLARRGVTVAYETVQQQGQALYLSLAHESEFPLVPLQALRQLAQRYRLFIFTGRKRVEYDAVWGARLNPLMSAVYCSDDVAGARPKPAPDYLCYLRETHGVEVGFYLGNNVDDMRCAEAAGFVPLGVATTQPAHVLQQAGAHRVFPTPLDALIAFPVQEPLVL